ncbi:MAG: hypothetical protein EOO16_00325 [Chitinophagaceae bacterium]|nr:MAG: hypothetical protein EOO16_00325 [Chitinophagaceae bacterium]
MRTILSLLLFLTFSNTSFAQDWKVLDESGPNYTVYYRPDRVIKNDNIITVWLKDVRTGAQLSAQRAKLARNTPSLAAKYKSYSYTLKKIMFDCSAHTLKITNAAEYDTAGNVIWSYTRDDVEWQECIPDSYGDVMSRNLCALYQ